jgi:thiol-disulfide isomerase/thioredoxin
MLVPFVTIVLSLSLTLGVPLVVGGARGPVESPRWAAFPLSWNHALYLVMLTWLVTRQFGEARKPRRVHRIVSVLLLVIFLVLLPSEAREWGNSIGTSLTVAPQVEKVFVGQRVGRPQFERLDGKLLTLDDPETLYVVNFWATWCPPCLKELPELLSLAMRFRDSGGVQIVAVNTEDLPNEELKSYLEEAGLEKLPVYRDSRDWHDVHGTGSIPLTLLIRDGWILRRYDGYAAGTVREIETTIQEESKYEASKFVAREISVGAETP